MLVSREFSYSRPGEKANFSRTKIANATAWHINPRRVLVTGKGNVVVAFLVVSPVNQIKNKRKISFSLSKKSSKYWAFSDRYGRMGKGDARCWNAGKWIEIW